MNQSGKATELLLGQPIADHILSHDTVELVGLLSDSGLSKQEIVDWLKMMTRLRAEKPEHLPKTPSFSAVAFNEASLTNPYISEFKLSDEGGKKFSELAVTMSSINRYNKSFGRSNNSPIARLLFEMSTAGKVAATCGQPRDDRELAVLYNDFSRPAVALSHFERDLGHLQSDQLSYRRIGQRTLAVAVEYLEVASIDHSASST